MEHKAFLTTLLNNFGINLPDYMVMGLFVMLLTLVGALLLTRRLSVEKPGLGQQFLELGVGGLRNMITDIIPHHGEKYLPWVGAFAVFILFSNLIGLVPGFTPPTSYWILTMALGISSMITYNFLGIRETGIHYSGHFFGPSFELGKWKFPWLFLLFIPLEMVTLFIARPFSLSLRLFANIMGDHQVGSAFLHIVPIGVPIPFMALGLLVCLIQAFIFTTLSIVFISLSVEHH